MISQELLSKYFTKHSTEQLVESIWYTGIINNMTFYIEEFSDEDLFYITIFKNHKPLIGIESNKENLESKLNKYLK
jgi:hypothetical protein